MELPNSVERPVNTFTVGLESDPTQAVELTKREWWQLNNYVTANEGRDHPTEFGHLPHNVRRVVADWISTRPSFRQPHGKQM